MNPPYTEKPTIKWYRLVTIGTVVVAIAFLFGYFQTAIAGPTSEPDLHMATDNSAPVLVVTQTLTLTPVMEDATDPAGNTIAQVLLSDGGDVITDADLGALEGIAVLGVNNTNGVWQYSLNPAEGAPYVWRPFGVISETNAVLLRDIDWVRFVPTANFSGPAGSMLFRAWDQTTGRPGQVNVDTSINGGSTAFSVGIAAASVTVTPVNDLPVISGLDPTPERLYVEGSAPVLLFCDEPLPEPEESEVINCPLTITDSDNQNLVSARVTINNPLDESFEVFSFDEEIATLAGINVNRDELGVLFFTGVSPIATYQALLHSVGYANQSPNPDTLDRTIQVTVSDSTGRSAPAFVTVKIEPVNDPPELDISGTGGTGNYTTVFFINRGSVSITSPALLLSDPDNTTIRSATIRISNLRNFQSEILNALVLGNISKSYDIDSGVLTLSGSDSIANYQRVLRTITYNNTLPQPNTEARIIEFRVNDGIANSVVRTTTVSFQVAPPVVVHMPVVSNRSEEPNDVCGEAFRLIPNLTQSFLPDDRNDWFYFNLTQVATVTVELTNFTPGRGQLIVAGGQGCNSLQLLGSNGDGLPNKTVSLGSRGPGRFYIWIISDGPLSNTTRYELLVRAVP